jgi:hypothetical protein
MTGAPSPSLKGVASLTLLVASEIWDARNARVFNNKHAPSMVIFANIKSKQGCGLPPVQKKFE